MRHNFPAPTLHKSFFVAVAAHTARHSMVSLAFGAAILGVAAGLASPAHAADSTAASEAVARLLALPVPSKATPTGDATRSDAPSKAAAHSATVQRGENLDRVIHRTLPKSAFKDDFLRSAFQQLNPVVLAQPSARALPAGTVLNVPSPQDLQTLLIARHPDWRNTKAPQEREDVADSSPATAKRRWVQYP